MGKEVSSRILLVLMASDVTALYPEAGHRVTKGLQAILDVYLFYQLSHGVWLTFRACSR